MKKIILENVRLMILAAVFSLGLGVAFAWTAPALGPTDGNVSAPINTGSSPQTKTGYIALPGGLGVPDIHFPDGTIQTTASVSGVTGNFTGMISFFVGATCPTGWVLANGAVVPSTGQSASLYSYIGTTYGAAGTLPNMTTGGRFIRSTGGNAAALGIAQIDGLTSHTHVEQVYYYPNNNFIGGVTSVSSKILGKQNNVPNGETVPSEPIVSTQATGGVETRPVNYAMTPCIKY